MTFETVTAFASCVVAIGGVGAIIPKGVRTLRRFGRLLDGFLGDGTDRNKSLPDRIATIEGSMIDLRSAFDEHVGREVPDMLSGGQEWGNRLEERGTKLQLDLDALAARLSAVEQKAAP